MKTDRELFLPAALAFVHSFFMDGIELALEPTATVWINQHAQAAQGNSS